MLSSKSDKTGQQQSTVRAIVSTNVLPAPIKTTASSRPLWSLTRPPKGLLTPQLQKRICDLLADANTIKTACDACAIGERTFYDWVERYPAFAAAISRARSRAKTKLVAVIRKAASDDWRAAA